MFGTSSTEPNFKLHLLRLEMQALYKKRENLTVIFAVVNRATTIRLKLPWDFNYLFIFIDSLHWLPSPSCYRPTCLSWFSTSPLS
jgi:TorA maturation chaperone TorD